MYLNILHTPTTFRTVSENQMIEKRGRVMASHKGILAVLDKVAGLNSYIKLRFKPNYVFLLM